jgi:hypothetical protein
MLLLYSFQTSTTSSELLANSQLGDDGGVDEKSQTAAECKEGPTEAIPKRIGKVKALLMKSC